MVTIGIVVLAGWTTGLQPLSTFLSNGLPTTANAAFMLVLLGGALALLASGHLPRLVVALAAVVATVAIVTALEYLLGVDLGIDRLLATGVVQPGAPYPGRMAISTAVALIAASVAVLLLARTRRSTRVNEALALIVGLVGATGVLGYLYGASELVSLGLATRIALPTAIGFAVLAAGLVAADPKHGLMRLLRDAGLAGQLTRRLVPAIVLVLPIAGWLELGLVDGGLIDQRVGVAAMVSLDVLVLAGVGTWIAGGVARLALARAAIGRERDRVLETSEDLVAVTDAEGRLTLVSPSWTRHLGYAPDELLGHAIAEFIHPDDLAADGEAFLVAVDHAGRVSGHVNRGRARDGTYRWLEWNSTRDPETGQLYIAARDITQRRVAEQALVESEQLMNQAQQLGSIGAWAYDVVTRTVTWTDEVYRIHEVSRDYDPNDPANGVEFYPTDDRARVAEASRLAFEEGRPYDLEVRFVTAKGRELCVRTVGQPQLEGDRVVRVYGTIQDITEQRRAEDQLRVAQSRQARFFDANIVGALIVRPTGVLLESNDYFLDLVGRTRDELERGEIDLVAMTPPEWQPATDRGLEAAATSGRIRAYEKEYLRPDGTRVPVIVSNTMLSDPDGLFASFVLDNTERKAADVALRESEERFRTLIESANDAVLMWDEDLRCLEANRAACERLGYTHDEMLTMTVTDISAPEEAGRAPARAESIAREGSGLVETVHRRRDGTLIQVEVSSTVVSFGGRRVFLSIARDISERKRATAALEIAHARLRRFVDANIVGVVVVGRDGTIVEANDSYLDIIGYTRDQLVAGEIDWLAITPPEWLEADERNTAELRERGTGTPYEKEYVRQDGRRVPVLIGETLLPGPDQEMAAFVIDVSRRKVAEDEARALNVALEERVEQRTAALAAANAELEAFSYSVSHDLRAPLRSIDGFSRILREEHAGALDAEGERVLGIVLRNVKQMGNLIDDLLAFSRVSRAGLERRPVDMARLAGTAAEDLRAAYPGREIAFDVGPLAGVPGDAALLRQVWANLLGNAVKFSGPIEHARVEVRSERVDGEYRYTVRDNGVGFDPAYVGKLFTPFSRLHSTADFEGTGIGLAIVARIVTRHGGRVWADGTPGGGATFGFALPTSTEAA